MKKLLLAAALLVSAIFTVQPVAAQNGKIICPGMPALTGDTTSSTGTCDTTTGKINGTTINSVPASGNLVGTTDTETLNNKTLASPVLSGTVSGAGTIPLATLVPNANSIASASTVDIGANFASGSFVTITGTTGISSLGSTAPAGSWYWMQFSSTLTITSGANLVLPGGNNMSTSSTPILLCEVPVTAGTWYCSNPLYSSVWNITPGGSMSSQNSVTATAFIVSGTTVPANGIYRPSANNLGFSSNSTAAGGFDTTQHVRLGGTGTPTIGSNNCGSTTQGTIGAGSTDRSGLVTVGTTGVTTCTISFSSSFGANPRAVILTPANSTASSGAATGAYVSSVGTTQFVITGTALAGAAYYYFVE